MNDKFLALLKAKAEAIRIGTPLDMATEVGPLSTRRQRDHIEKIVAASLDAGTGTRDRRPRWRNWRGLTTCRLFLDCDGVKAPSVETELFGPILSVLSFNTEDEVIAPANATPYGLASGVFTRSLGRAHRMVKCIRAGIVRVNTYRAVSPIAPFGGYGQRSVRAARAGSRQRSITRAPRPCGLRTSDDPSPGSLRDAVSRCSTRVRTYRLKNGAIPDYLRVVGEEGIAIQKKHLGNLVGYFYLEIGPINEIVHIWGFKSSLDEPGQGALRALPPIRTGRLSCRRIRDLIVTADNKINVARRSFRRSAGLCLPEPSLDEPKPMNWEDESTEDCNQHFLSAATGHDLGFAGTASAQEMVSYQLGRYARRMPRRPTGPNRFTEASKYHRHPGRPDRLRQDQGHGRSRQREMGRGRCRRRLCRPGRQCRAARKARFLRHRQDKLDPRFVTDYSASAASIIPSSSAATRTPSAPAPRPGPTCSTRQSSPASAPSTSGLRRA